MLQQGAVFFLEEHHKFVRDKVGTNTVHECMT
jgi:hypothetical protein